MKLWMIIVMLGLGVAQTFAQPLGVLRSGTSGGSAVGPSCPNGLDFTNSCDAVYLNVVVF
jgi:hypothetical protein